VGTGLDVVVEGTAVRVTEQQALQRLADAYEAKYGSVWHSTSVTECSAQRGCRGRVPDRTGESAGVRQGPARADHVPVHRSLTDTRALSALGEGGAARSYDKVHDKSLVSAELRCQCCNPMRLGALRRAERKEFAHAYILAVRRPLLAALASLLVPAVASGANGFTEQIASARGRPRSSARRLHGRDGRMIVETDNFIDAGRASPNPPSGSGSRASVRTEPSIGLHPAGADAVRPELKSVKVSGTFANVSDSRGGSHTVSVNASWTGTGAIQTTVNTPGSKSKKRSATATATIVFDGRTLVNGASNFPFPAPFIRIDSEK